MKRPLLLGAGIVSLALGIAGIALPLLPTTPFVLLAAACFAHANPAWERRLLEHPRYGASIRAWRERRAIPAVAKRAAVAMLVISAVGGWFALRMPMMPKITAHRLVISGTQPKIPQIRLAMAHPLPRCGGIPGCIAPPPYPGGGGYPGGGCVGGAV